MKAVGYYRNAPITVDDALVDLELPRPQPGARDLLVAVRAVSVNPVDTKQRKGAAPPAGEARVLGFDATGIVEAVGPEVTLFRPGEAVFYAGTLIRPGTNAEYHLVDERIVGHKPASLSFAQAAAMPLTSITAWELLFDRLGVRPGKPANAGSLLIVGGAGGVGSMLIQLARRLTGLVIDHRRPFAEELRRIGIPAVEYVAGLNATDQHFASIVEALAPQGHFALIDDPATFDIRPLKRKSVAVHWEFMFTRSMFATADVIAQHNLLEEVSALVDAGVLRSTLSEHGGAVNAATLKRAHALVESGKAKGKIVLEGF
jgi:NADPH2:quinone reductase